MKERRPLTAGIKTDFDLKEIEKEFVFRETASTEVPPQDEPETAKQHAEPIRIVDNSANSMPQIAGRVPITTRCRPELATALKQASLQRQLSGQKPYYVQEIMEKALQVWLTQNGYI